MKCQRKASPYSACFASRSCARFSPTTETPASTSAAMSPSATYFVAATTVTAGPTCSCTSARRARTCSGDSTDHSLHAAGEAVAAVGEEKLRVISRADVDPVDAVHACGPERALRGRPEIESALAGEVGVEAVGDRGPDLVAAGADRGSDHGSLLARPQRLHPRLDDALRQAAPAGV